MQLLAALLDMTQMMTRRLHLFTSLIQGRISLKNGLNLLTGGIGNHEQILLTVRNTFKNSTCTLKCKLNPVPIIQSKIARKRPSLPNIILPSQPPKVRNTEPDQMPQFNDMIVIYDRDEKLDAYLRKAPKVSSYRK